MEILEKKLQKIRVLSRANWIIGITKIIAFIIALALIISASIGTTTYLLTTNDYNPYVVVTRNYAIYGVAIFFWVAFAGLAVSTIVMNIIIAINSSSSAIMGTTNKDLAIKEVLSSTMVLAIVGVFFVSMILNIIIYVRVSALIKNLQNIE